MTTSLPTASSELPLAGTSAGTAATAGSLLDLLAAAQLAQTGQPHASLTQAGGVPSEAFATLLAPAQSSAAVPIVAPQPAPAAPLVPGGSTSARALRLPVVNETAPATPAPTLATAEGESATAPLDRDTLEAALALVASLFPALTPAPQPVPPAGLTLTAGTAQEGAGTPAGESLVSASSAAPAPLRLSLTTRDGTPLAFPEITTPAIPSVPVASPAPAPAAQHLPLVRPPPVNTAVAPIVTTSPATPTPPAPLTASAMQPVSAELEWDNGLRLSADLVPLGRSAMPVATATGQTASPANPATSPVSTHAHESQMPLAPMPASLAAQPEKNASSAHVVANSSLARDSSSEKNFLNTGNKEVTPDHAQAGIAVAESRPAMPAAPQHLPNVAPATSPVSAAAPQVERPAAPASAARRAVDTVVEIVHAQVVSRLQPVPSVQLRFKVGHEDLSVRVQLRDGEVRTEFRTDNPELRAAVAQEWRAVTAKPDTALRFLDPIFLTAPGQPASQSGTNSQHQHHQHAQAQQEQQHQQQFRSQLEMFGSVRRSIPTPIAAELAPVTPLPTATSHRLSAVA